MSRSLISFDAAGTLIEVAEPVATTYQCFAADHGVSVSEAALKAAFRSAWQRLPTPFRPEGQPADDDERSWWKQLVAEVFRDALEQPLPFQVLNPLFDQLYSHYERPEAWRVYDEALPVLRDLSSNFELCVCSNFDRRLLKILDGHGLSSFFGAIILSSEVGAAKPHRRPFDTALRAMQTLSAHSLHVGDDLKCDIEGARSAGWAAFQVQRPAQDLRVLVEKVYSGAYSGLLVSER